MCPQDYVIDETIELWRFNYGGKSLDAAKDDDDDDDDDDDGLLLPLPASTRTSPPCPSQTATPP